MSDVELTAIHVYMAGEEYVKEHQAKLEVMTDGQLEAYEQELLRELAGSEHPKQTYQAGKTT